MKTNEIRQAFLDYFQKRDHQIVASSPLVPANDPTLLFTNAGMVQFKEVFLGIENRPYTCATSSQRCVRAGGKHNDLENVGYTARHHTFFEMLGNFSFGDYFKREAITYAWDFLTNTLQLPAEKLWITVYTDDNEAAEIWLNEIKVEPKRFSRCGEKENFWAMGDTGPCGPCTEIFYDHGPDIEGGPPGSPEEDGDRYIEIWNLVFMQYNRSPDGELMPLPKPSVDTGMGLERIAAVMQGVHNNYDIDLFQNLITAIIKLSKTKNRGNHSLRVIADHIRSCAFIVADGVTPSNEGRGYVLRRIIRRAVRHGHQLGLTDTFFYKLVKPLVDEMGAAYPELVKAQERVEKVLLQEEQQFEKTLSQGLKILEHDIKALSGNVISGETVFKLYDTYGFPSDLTADIARERNLSIDMQGFQVAMERQRQQSQAASQFGVDYTDTLPVEGETEFTGYHGLQCQTKIIALFKEGKAVEALAQGEQGSVVLEATPFYAQSGGQVGDTGVLSSEDNEFTVNDTKKQGQVVIHQGVVVSGTLTLDATVNANVDADRRYAIMLNHSATHLLHAALQRVLGDHVIQKGSLVEASRLRFDFSQSKAMTADEIVATERLVNQQIRANLLSHVELMTPDEATEQGAMALFGEKYGEQVRVLSMGEFSKELCGGTHVERSGDIGLFKIISESGVAAGVRRIEAITGEVALDWLMRTENQLQTLAQQLKTQMENVSEKVSQLLQHNRSLEKEVSQLKSQLATSTGSDLTTQAQSINGINVLAVKMLGVDMNTLRTTLDHAKNKLGTAVVVLAGVTENRVNVVAGISKDCIGKVPAPKELVVAICGKGGGRDDMAQGGGPVPADLDERLKKIPTLIKEAL